ncbi:MAG: ATP synthase F1 subunit epsilon [Endomicrobium sp.]|jgi:F-type H+-transporting ATPase subunit epsilon|nr:ATP synthase F1 subunit epsilon [Endomicrobium sp.]
MNKFKIEILSSNGIVLKEDIISASFPTVNGMITILPKHTNIIAKLSSGEIIINTVMKDIKRIIISSGFLEVSNNNINVISEFIIQSKMEKIEKIKKAIELANKLKEKRKKSSFISTEIEFQLKKNSTGLKSDVRLRNKKI